MFRIAVLVSGGGTNLQNLLDGIADGSIPQTEIVEVICNRADAFALKRAEQAGVPAVAMVPKTFENREAFNDALLAELQRLNPDLIVMAGWLVVLPERIINAFENRIINVHPSLIPSFCGAGFYGLRVHEAALEYGVKLTGATVHFVTYETDAGPILFQKAVEVRPDDTPEVLQRRVMEEAEKVLLPKAVRMLALGQVKIEGRKVTVTEPVE